MERASRPTRTDAAKPDALLLCADRRCRTLLPAHAEICDECGGTDRGPFTGARLEGSIGDRPVGFAVDPGRPNVIGRAVAGEDPIDVDLARSREAGSVHRRHAQLERDASGWRITHLGRNPLVIVRGAERAALAPGASAPLRSGDRVIVGMIQLRFTAD